MSLWSRLEEIAGARPDKVAITAPAIKCCLGISDELSEAIPRVSVNRDGSSSSMKASRNSFQAIMNT